MKDSVKAQVAESELVDYKPELSLAVISDQRARVVRPNRKIK